MKYIGFVLVAFMLISSCGYESKSGNESVIQFNSGAYDSMRNFFSSDTMFVAIMTDRIKEGDTNAFKLKALLDAKYEYRNATGVTDSSIAGMILAFRATKNVKDRFNDIDSSISMLRSDSVRRKTNNVLKSLDSLKKELEQLNHKN